ncbi:MAG: HAMP domain-containing sensor histidine kinase [Planctomycetota bacterium]|nr:HAMP domain-containing sensor histidine kinase [Planctomycetota bacterium]
MAPRSRKRGSIVLELESGQLVMIGIGSALLVIMLVAVGYLGARILGAGATRIAEQARETPAAADGGTAGAGRVLALWRLVPAAGEAPGTLLELVEGLGTTLQLARVSLHLARDATTAVPPPPPTWTRPELAPLPAAEEGLTNLLADREVRTTLKASGPDGPLSLPGDSDPDGAILEERINGWCLASCRKATVVPVEHAGELLGVLLLEDDRPDRDLDPEVLEATSLLGAALGKAIAEGGRGTAVQEFEETYRARDRAGVIEYLASSTSHDYNNLVFAIGGRLQILQRTLTDPEAVRTIEALQSTLEQPPGILARLREVNDARPGRVRSIAIAPGLGSLADRAKAWLGESVLLEVRIDVPPRTFVGMSEEGLWRIVVNLLDNARTAMAGRPGRVRLSAEGPETPEGGQGHVRLRIEDDGPGIEAASRAGMVEPFATTRPAGTGSGLGLSIVERTVRDHGGRLSLEEAPGGGLRAEIELRVVEPPDA